MNCVRSSTGKPARPSLGPYSLVTAAAAALAVTAVLCLVGFAVIMVMAVTMTAAAAFAMGVIVRVIVAVSAAAAALMVMVVFRIDERTGKTPLDRDGELARRVLIFHQHRHHLGADAQIVHRAQVVTAQTALPIENENGGRAL